MASFPNLLSPLQRRILDAVSARLSGMFLSGGTALGAFYLGHRRSAALDLFTREGAEYDAHVRQFVRLAEGEGWSIASGAAGPGFRRFVVSDADETVPVDLVLDTAERIAPPTITTQGLVVDSLDDIAANKLGAILGRAEVREYWRPTCRPEPKRLLRAARARLRWRSMGWRRAGFGHVCRALRRP